MSNYVHGKDFTKWWVFRAGIGKWVVVAPPSDSTFITKFPSGAAALEAFANGK